MEKLIDKTHFINRELSWLNFNSRVLDQAFDKNNPLLERLKFMAIFSNNLDEFFMIRVSGIRQQFEDGIPIDDPSGLNAAELLKLIRLKVASLLKRQYTFLQNHIIPELKHEGIHLLRLNQVSEEEKSRLAGYFKNNILPILTPIGIISDSTTFPVINNKVIEIVVELKKKNNQHSDFGFVEVPSGIPRFIEVNHLGPGRAFILLEDLIIEHIHVLFSGCTILNTMLFRITKDMDFVIDDEDAQDFLSHVENTLKTVRKRKAIRLEVLSTAQKNKLLKWLIEKLAIPKDNVYCLEDGGPLDLSCFFDFIPLVAKPELINEKFNPLKLAIFEKNGSVFDAIKQLGTIPVFHPFESFDCVIRFLNEAVNDPNVLAIKQTLYRVSGDSPIVHALQRAAENNKQVTVVVELKARFDESKNIEWAKKLEDSGAHVIYGIAKLKIHCKALLVVRKEETSIKRYLHLSTGNYNDSTAKIYTDIGIFSVDTELCSDIAALFNVMTGYSEPPEWNKIAVAPFNLRETFISLINREMRLSTPHRRGHIIAKMNSLVDKEIIEYLYKAAYAGVKIDLIVRGICCLRPKENTKNISIISIVDKYLEHSRIYYFANNGSPEYYLSSSDWMPRNLDKRIEILYPIKDEFTQNLFRKILVAQLQDTYNGRKLNCNGNYSKNKTRRSSSRSQTLTYDILKRFKPNQKKQKLIVFKKIEEKNS